MTVISSQSNICVKSYGQNTEGCPDGLTERLDSQLQPPFQNSTESFHNVTPRLLQKDVSENFSIFTWHY